MPHLRPGSFTPVKWFLFVLARSENGSVASPEPTSDLLKRVTAAACKAIARRSEMAVQFGHGGATADEETIHLPTPPPQVNKHALTKLRGIADSLSLRLRYHDEAIHRQNLPKGALARAVFEAVEQVRCESIGTRRMAGVAGNLEALLDERCRAKGFAGVTERKDADLADVIGLLAREQITGQVPPTSAQQMVGVWRQWLDKQLGDKMRNLGNLADDQDAFAPPGSTSANY